MQACAWNVFSESEPEGGDSTTIYLQLAYKPAKNQCMQLTFVEGHNRNVTTLLGMNLSRNSLTVNCFGET